MTAIPWCGRCRTVVGQPGHMTRREAQDVADDHDSSHREMAEDVAEDSRRDLL